MESSRHPTPHALDPDKVEWSVAEIDAAIELVSSGLALSVRLCELPEIESAAAFGLSHAQAAGIPFRFVRHGDGPPFIVVGPRETTRIADNRS